MGWVTGIVVYILVWWVTIFAVLPLWVVPAETGDSGHQSGAPNNPRLIRKALVTTGLATIIWIAIYLVVRSPYMSFRGALQ